MSTLTVHVPPAAIVAALKETEPAAATGAHVGAPQPLVDALGVPATTIAAGATGKVSVKATPVSAVAAFGFTIVKVSVVTPPAPIGLVE